MVKFVELEQVNPIIAGVTVEASHLRAFQTLQSAPSNAINFAQPFNVALELEFGGPGMIVPLPLAFNISYFFQSLTGGNAVGPIATGLQAIVAGTFNYSNFTNPSTSVVVGAAALPQNSAYQVGALVQVSFPNGVVIYQGFIDGLVLSDI